MVAELSVAGLSQGGDRQISKFCENIVIFPFSPQILTSMEHQNLKNHKIARSIEKYIPNTHPYRFIWSTEQFGAPQPMFTGSRRILQNLIKNEGLYKETQCKWAGSVFKINKLWETEAGEPQTAQLTI